MGVSCFDGYKFRVFTTADGLTDNTVFKFYEDYKGRIWFYTYSGKLCYYFHEKIYGRDLPVNQKIRNFLGSDLMTGIRVDTHDTILLSSSKGLLQIIPDATQKDSWSEMKVISDRKSFLMDDEYITVERLHEDSILLTHYKTGKDPAIQRMKLNYWGFIEPARYQYESLLLFHEIGTVVVGHDGHSYMIDSMKVLISSFEERDSSIWLGQKHGGVHHFAHGNLSMPVRSLLKPYSVTCTMKDREGGYWFTTLEDGLFYLSSAEFTYFEKNIDPRSLVFSSFSENLLFPLGPDKILGLTSKKKYSIGNINQSDPDPFYYSAFERNWPLWNICMHSSGEVWMSTSVGILVFDRPGGRQTDLILIPKECGENDTRLIIEDDQHDMWSLNQSSLMRIDHRSKAITKIVLIPSRASTACPDNDGNMLIGTINGLYKLVGDSLISMGERHSIFKNRFVDIKRFGRRIVVASRGAGVIILEGGSLYQVRVADGLLSDMCRSIYVDQDGVIWVATNSGLNSITIKEHPFKTVIKSFSTSDGLLSNDNDQVLKNGKIVWLLSKKGITAFDPDVAVPNNIPPPIYITRVQVNNVSHTPESIKVLDYSTNFIEIDFVGLAYRNAGRQVYKYRLSGYDTTLKYTQNTSVQFTKLPPGEYRFEVSGTNSSGVESSIPAIYSFSIEAPFYLKWWFNFCLSLIIIVLIILVAIVYIRRIRAREAEKTEINRKIARLELQALRAQMNPHFIFNCLNAILDFILKNDTISAKYYLTMFSKLIRTTLNGSRKPSIRLADEIEFLELYLDLEKMRFSNKFNYIIDKNDVGDLNVEIPSMILQPFIENSIKHGKIGSLHTPGELIITFSLKENVLHCRIEDNGIGFDRSQREKDKNLRSDQPHALGLINERIRTINEINRLNIYYTIVDKSELGQNRQGTLVNIHIPVK
jgi:hypothetical protein